MERTHSYYRVLPSEILERYELAEVRNAAATMAGTSPEELDHIKQVLGEFRLTLEGLTDPGGSKGPFAVYLDQRFRALGWREAGHQTRTEVIFRLEPYRAAGEKTPTLRVVTFLSEGHKVDNVRGRVALEVEWNAKDGNLDRDLANFRALHDAALIDVGVIITRHQEQTKYAANRLAELSGRIRYKNGQRVILLGTSTTTNLEKLVPRLERGEGGGCPILAVAATDRCYVPRPGDPVLPPFGGPIVVEGAPEQPSEDEA